MTTLTLESLYDTHARIESLPLYITEIDSNGKMHVYVYDHASLTNGYIRKNATCYPKPYKGNFGTGYTVNVYNSRSTRYALKAYYIEVSHKVICSANDSCTLCPLYATTPSERCYYEWR